LPNAAWRSRWVRFVSYAQNGEDFLLWRLLNDVEAGTYIDIGACEPETDSVTRAFYERGWSGINVEPVPAYWEQLCRSRARDVNLNIAVGAGEGECDFFTVRNTGLSTLDSAIAERHRRAGFDVLPMRVRVRPLREVWDEFVHGEVHFLKIDVEGAEADVLAGADLARQRPWIILVEATAPLTRQPTHERWEPTLSRAGYRFVHADLVNRYYVSGERAALAQRLPLPDEIREVVRATELEAFRDDLPPKRRFDPSQVSFLRNDQPTPTLRDPVSQLCTESQLREPVYGAWCQELAEPVRFHRKLWEYAYILQVLAVHRLLASGRRGLGFGCGRQPLTAVMATHGCEIVATDSGIANTGPIDGVPPARTVGETIEDLDVPGLCDPELFRRRVTRRTVEMNRESPDLETFDFVFSTSVLARQGSIRRGTEFALGAMRFLKPGGLAVYITEFNLSSNYTTFETRDSAIFRRYDIDALIADMARAGHTVEPLNLNAGTGPVDRYVDLPPYRPEPHLRLRVGRYVTTSLGLIVRKH
jgi:FkbM family methyltransferase